MPYRALVCDLDGTLLLQPPDLDRDLVAGCRRAVSRGLIFCVATGRMPPGAERYLAELDASGPGIFYNGALVRDSEDGRDLMRLLDIPPGRQVGQILGRLLERVIDDPSLNTREALEALARAELPPAK